MKTLLILGFLVISSFSVLRIPLSHFQSTNFKSAISNMLEQEKNSTTYLENMGIVNFISPYKITYIGTFEIGTPPKKFNAILDTGSSDIWIANKGCEHCEGHDTYDNQLSSSYSEIGNQITLSYGSANVTGITAKERIGLNGFYAENQVFLQATNIAASGGYEDQGYDGLVGLGFVSLAQTTKSTLIDSLKAQGQIKHRNFGFDMKNNVFLVGIEKKHDYNNSTIRYFKVVNNFYWMINIDGVTYGTTFIPVKTALIDSGTSLVVVDQNTYLSIEEYLTVDPNILCGNYDFPNFTIKIDGHEYTLNQDDYIISNTSQCFGIMSQDFLQGIILGDIFFRKYFVLFDLDKRQIGISGNSNLFRINHFVLLSLFIIYLIS